jgi:hypothetical protein
MTTYTITCPATFAGTSETITASSRYIGSGLTPDFQFKNRGTEELYGTRVNQTDSDGGITIAGTDSRSVNGTISIQNTDGIGYVFEDSAAATVRTTISFAFSANGNFSYLRTFNDSRVAWPDFVETGSGVETTSAESTTTTTQRISTSTTTVSGNTTTTASFSQVSQRGTTNSQSQATTTTTTASELGFDQTTFLSEKITTITEEESMTSYIGGTRVFAEATVVLLEASETGFLVTTRPNFTLPSSAVFAPANATQFTVLPSNATTQGAVVDAVSFTKEGLPDFVFYSYTTASSVSEISTVYETTLTSSTTVTVGSSITQGATAAQLPPYTRTLATTTLTTATTEYTNSVSLFTGGDTSETTIWNPTTHADRLSQTTWIGTHFARRVVTTSFPVASQTSFSSTAAEELGGEWVSTTSTATNTYTEEITFEDEPLTVTSTTTITVDTVVNSFGSIEVGTTFFSTTVEAQVVSFNRPITVGAALGQLSQAQNQRAMSVFNGHAAPFSLTEPALLVGADGITVRGETSSVFAARTARLPMPMPARQTWSYVDNASTVNVSVNGAGLTASSVYGPTSALSTSTQSGEWTTSGQAISTGSVPFAHRRNMGGRPATGNSATALLLPGVWQTSSGNSSGTFEATAAATQQLGSSAARTAYAGHPIAISGNNRYVVVPRNSTALVASSQLLL